MINHVLSYIREIFTVNLMSEIFKMLVAGASYRKYISCISGLASLIICLQMAAYILNIDITSNVKDTYELYLSENDAQISALLGGNVQSAYIQGYKQTNYDYIRGLAEDLGLNVTDVNIELNETDIAAIEVTVEKDSDTDKYMELKRAISDIYGIDSSNISVYWRR